MTLITIDETRCRRDGICVAECPMGILEQIEPHSTPVAVEGAESLCIRCGHCVAVCPRGALSQPGLSPVDCAPLLDLPDGEGVARLLKGRRSIRSFRAEPLERAQIEHLLGIARFAPSGHNIQPVHWLVVPRPRDVQRLAGLVAGWMRSLVEEGAPLAASLHLDRVVAAWDGGEDPICRGAPHLVIAHAPKTERAATPACTIALSYLELAAFAGGLGACWAGYFNAAANAWPPLQQALALPDGHAPFGALMLGYPKYRYQRIPPRRSPRVAWWGQTPAG